MFKKLVTWNLEAISFVISFYFLLLRLSIVSSFMLFLKPYEIGDYKILWESNFWYFAGSSTAEYAKNFLFAGEWFDDLFISVFEVQWACMNLHIFFQIQQRETAGIQSIISCVIENWYMLYVSVWKLWRGIWKFVNHWGCLITNFEVNWITFITTLSSFGF